MFPGQSYVHPQIFDLETDARKLVAQTRNEFFALKYGSDILPIRCRSHGWCLMKKKLIIVGCGGHAKVALECALSTGQYQVVGFSDDFTKGSFKGYKILGSLASVKNKYSDESEIQFFIAVG